MLATEIHLMKLYVYSRARTVDLAITLAGQVLFTTAVFLRPSKPCRRRMIWTTLIIGVWTRLRDEQYA